MDKRIDVITTSRADFGLISPIANALQEIPGITARLLFTGSHFSSEDVKMVDQLCREFPGMSVKVPCKGIGQDFKNSGLALGDMTVGFSRLWEKDQPAMIVLLGDRYELLPPATVAVLARIPIAHMFGGEVDVSYCLDTQVRDAITKMAHVHFVTHEVVKKRIENMGEEEWRIKVVGNPAVETLVTDSSSFLKFATQKGWQTEKLIAACYLPPTTQRDQMFDELMALLNVLQDWQEYTVVWAGVNADPGGAEIREILLRYCQQNENHHFVSGLGSERFHGLLQTAQLLIGNSSSGLLEAASYQLPVVNIGVRQTGRLSGINVLNVSGNEEQIRKAMEKAVHDQSFLQQIKEQNNPFRKPHASKIVAKEISALLDLPIEKLLLKRAVIGNPQAIGGLQRVPEYPTM